MSIPRKGLRCTAMICLLLLIPGIVSAAEAPPSSNPTEHVSPTWVQLGKRLKASPSTFADIDASRHALSPSLANRSTTPYLTWIEHNTHGVPQIRVTYWTQGAWIPLGDTLNLSSSHRAYNPMIATAGSDLHVAWIELDKKGVAQLHVKQWTSSGWILVGKSLNEDPEQPAANSSIAVIGERLYVAWAERNAQRVYQIHVKVLTEDGWVKLGGALNENGTRNAIEPSIASVGSTPYVAWCEKADNGYLQIYVKHWTGQAWVRDGASLNMDLSAHALSPSIASNGEAPYVAWVEFNAEGISQLYVRHWMNNGWVSNGGGLNLDPNHHALSPSLAFREETPYLAWAESNSNGIMQIHVRHWTGSDWAPDGQSLNLDTSRLAMAPTLAVLEGRPYVAWKEADDSGLFSIVVKAGQ